LNKPPRYFREPFNGLSHLIGAILALIGFVYLMFRGWGDTTRVIAYLIYGISLILLFSASAAYHLIHASDRTMLVLRKFDHTAIYLLIAGSYTPMCLIFFEGFWRFGMLTIIWSMALVGIIVKLFVIKAPRWVTAGLYLLMGWTCVMAIGEMIRTMPAGAFIWLILGGLFYTVGAVIYITRKLDFKPDVFGFHEVWHIFVILGAASHFIMIAVFTV
jgi:hemolysin III